MLSIGAVTPQSVGYYQRQVARGDGVRAAGYYQQPAEPPGQWAGAGAGALGLAGPLAEGDLATLLAGTVPGTGQVLGRLSKNLGLDLTFSAPKSASVLGYLLDERTHAEVLGAHEAAVTAAVGWLEAEAAVVRRGHAGAIEQRAAGLIGARFDHATSRDLDPQLHSHVVVSSLAAGPDGRHTGLHARQLYRCAATAGHLYQATLRAELTSRLGVGWTEPVKGQAEIAGMPAALLKELSSRRQAIQAEADRILADARRANTERLAAGHPPRPVPHGRALWQQATLATRKAKDHDAAHDLATLVPAWQQQACDLGYDLDPHRFLEQLHRAAPALDTVPWAAFAGQLAGRDGLTANKAWVDRRDVIQAIAAGLHRLDPAELAPGETPAAAAARLADRWCAEHAVALHRPDQVRQTGRWALRYTTDSHLACERAALAAVLAGQAETTTGLGDPATAARAITELTLAEEQADAVTTLVAGGAGTDVLIAPAGTGKTRLLAAAVASWQAAGLAVIGTSTAAKAVRELADGAGITDTRTLARLKIDLDRGERVEQRTGEQGTRRPVRVPFALTDRHVLVVDEAAMAGTRDLHRLLTDARTAGSKVVLVGDPRQLPSIAAGGLMATAARHLDDPELTGHEQPRTIRLTETRRAAEQWERDAQLAWHQGRAEDALALYEQHDRVHYGLDEDTAYTRMVADWHDRRADLAAEQAASGNTRPAPEPLMVAHRRVQVHQLNTLARQALVAAGELDPERSVTATIDVGGATGSVTVPIGIGEPVITTRADRALGVINGTRGTVSRLHHDGTVTIQTSPDTSIDLPAAYLADGGLHPAYALSAHRAQGSTAPAALVLADTSTMTAEWGYSAATRGRRNDLYVLAPDSDPPASPAPRGNDATTAVVLAAEQRAALLAAMTRTGDQVSALDIAHEDGLDLEQGGSAGPDLATTPTEDDYALAARLAAVSSGRSAERPAAIAAVDLTALALAAARAAAVASPERAEATATHDREDLAPQRQVARDHS